MSSQQQEVNTWLTSDLHLGHPLVSELRGFGRDEADIARHDSTILGNLIAPLNNGDSLWILGDISSGWHPQEEIALEKLAQTFRTSGAPDVQLHLISGNHDSTHPLFEEAFQRQSRFLEVFDSVQALQRRRWRGHDVWLSHFPRPGQDHIPGGSRHDELRLDVPLLVHGHLHSEKPITGLGQVDVGLDPWGFHPVPEYRVVELLFDKSGWRSESSHSVSLDK